MAGGSQFRSGCVYPKSTYKKSAGSWIHRSSRLWGLRIALYPRISNAEAHAVCILNRINNITQWALNIALPCGYIRICEVPQAADKTLTQRLLNMSVARLPPARTSERTTWQKYEINGKWKTENGKVFGKDAGIVLFSPFHYSSGFPPASFVAAHTDNHACLFQVSEAALDSGFRNSQ